MNHYKWTAVPLVLIVLFAGLVLVNHGNSSENQLADIELGATAVVSYPNVGEAILADCAKTACVAAKANEMAAQAAAEAAAAAAAAQAAQLAAEEQAYGNWLQTSSSNSQTETSPPPQPVRGPPTVIRIVVGPDFCTGPDGRTPVDCDDLDSTP